MNRTWVLAATLLAWTDAAVAQIPASPAVFPAAPSNVPALSPPSSQAVAPVQTPVNDGVRLPADTVVRIALVDDVNSKDRARGDKFAIRLAAPIVLDGRTVVPPGATGMGEIVYAERGGGGGSPGKLVLAARYLDVGGVRLRLKAFQLSAGGESDFREMQVAAEFLSVGVMFIHGHNVEYPIGTRANAKIAEDTVLPTLPEPVAPAETTPSQPPAAQTVVAAPITPRADTPAPPAVSSPTHP